MFRDPGMFILVSSPGGSDPVDSDKSLKTQLQGLLGRLFCDTPLLRGNGKCPFSCCCSGRGTGIFTGSLSLHMCLSNPSTFFWGLMAPRGVRARTPRVWG